MIVQSVTLVGGAYHRGRYVPGNGWLNFTDGSRQFVSDGDAVGFEGCLAVADRFGHDTTQARAHIAEWVKTGVGATFSLLRSR